MQTSLKKDWTRCLGKWKSSYPLNIHIQRFHHQEKMLVQELWPMILFQTPLKSLLMPKPVWKWAQQMLQAIDARLRIPRFHYHRHQHHGHHHHRYHHHHHRHNGQRHHGQRHHAPPITTLSPCWTNWPDPTWCSQRCQCILLPSWQNDNATYELFPRLLEMTSMSLSALLWMGRLSMVGRLTRKMLGQSLPSTLWSSCSILLVLINNSWSVAFSIYLRVCKTSLFATSFSPSPISWCLETVDSWRIHPSHRPHCGHRTSSCLGPPGKLKSERAHLKYENGPNLKSCHNFTFLGASFTVRCILGRLSVTWRKRLVSVWFFANIFLKRIKQWYTFA